MWLQLWCHFSKACHLLWLEAETPVWSNFKQRSVKRHSVTGQKLAAQEAQAIWMTITGLMKCTQIKEENGRGRGADNVCAICRHQQNIYIYIYLTSLLVDKVTKAGKLLGCPDESVRNNACHHSSVNRRVRLGGQCRRPRHRAMMTPPQICISDDSSEPQAESRHQD